MLNGIVRLNSIFVNVSDTQGLPVVTPKTQCRQLRSVRNRRAVHSPPSKHGDIRHTVADIHASQTYA